jgi:hypothetical protein
LHVGENIATHGNLPLNLSALAPNISTRANRLPPLPAKGDPVSSITRENHAANQALSLRERIATESREWDAWALKNQQLARLLSQELPPGTTITSEMQQRFPQPFGLWTTMPGYFWEYQHLGYHPT